MSSLPVPADSKFANGRVVERREITPDLWMVRVRPDERIHFLPGQYITAGLPGTPRMVERPYSVVSSPREPDLEFFLELVPAGQLTPQLYQIPVGGEVFLRRAAKGRFLLDDRSGNPNHFMAATVTGVAPYVSMLRDLIARAEAGEAISQRLLILQGASTPQELGYAHELSAHASRHEWFRYIPTISRPWLDPGWEGEKGRVEAVARKYLDDLGFTASNTTAYVCGNPDMIGNVKAVLRRAGFSKEAVKEEVYWHAEKQVRPPVSRKSLHP
jgi:ferredoxin--NADP+ reductase